MVCPLLTRTLVRSSCDSSSGTVALPPPAASMFLVRAELTCGASSRRTMPSGETNGRKISFTPTSRYFTSCVVLVCVCVVER